MTGRLEGKVAIVTGAGRGLGRAIARRFAAEGAAIGALSLTPSGIDETVALIQQDGGRAIGVRCDLGDTASIRPSIEKVVEAFGTVDILVNNGHDVSVDSMTAPFETASVEQMMRQFTTGPIGSVVAMQACFPYLKRKGGAVINVGSAVGVKGIAKFAPYAMAKEAIRAATRVAAQEWGKFGITVNTVCPAADTPGARTTIASGVLGDLPRVTPPIARHGSSEDDIAPVFLFLASADAQFMTGHTFMVDGGITIDAGR